jgi:putative Mn2+ efflux pump MntP
MIDWLNLAENILWIIGCAVILATLSYASYEASTRHERFLIRLKQRAVQITLNIGAALFSAGLAATSQTLILTIAWVILCLIFLAQVVVLARQDSRDQQAPNP